MKGLEAHCHAVNSLQHRLPVASSLYTPADELTWTPMKLLAVSAFAPYGSSWNNPCKLYKEFPNLRLS